MKSFKLCSALSKIFDATHLLFSRSIAKTYYPSSSRACTDISADSSAKVSAGTHATGGMAMSNMNKRTALSLLTLALQAGSWCTAYCSARTLANTLEMNILVIGASLLLAEDNCTGTGTGTDTGSRLHGRRESSSQLWASAVTVAVLSSYVRPTAVAFWVSTQYCHLI